MIIFGAYRDHEATFDLGRCSYHDLGAADDHVADDDTQADRRIDGRARSLPVAQVVRQPTAARAATISHW